MKLRKEFTFDAAHNLIRYKGACERLHGHTYRLAVDIEGTLNDDEMVVDFCEVSSIVRENAVSLLDHAYLNDLVEQPTAENIALWVWNRIESSLERRNCALSAVTVWETATSSVVIGREDVHARRAE
jgi:6-pyruvoyltetrahydropterin/6-carboxytetrahydropterin synthase